MSTAEGTSAAERPAGARAAARVGTIVVVGGGCYGSYYVRQLARGRAAGAIVWERLVVIDRDPACRVAREGGEVPGLVVEVAEWGAWFDAYLADAPGPADAIVPSPLMPHLMAEWLARRIGARAGLGAVAPVPLPRVPSLPWARAGADGTHFVSAAEWMCPVNCIEPATCPAIAGPRTWSLPRHVKGWVEAERAAGRDVEGPVVLHCAHRAYGVGMFDTTAVLEGDRLAAEAAARGASHLLVATVSHCHGALALLPLPASAPRGPAANPGAAAGLT